MSRTVKKYKSRVKPVKKSKYDSTYTTNNSISLIREKLKQENEKPN